MIGIKNTVRFMAGSPLRLVMSQEEQAAPQGVLRIGKAFRNLCQRSSKENQRKTQVI
jgi:hypothetical protein